MIRASMPLFAVLRGQVGSDERRAPRSQCGAKLYLT